MEPIKPKITLKLQAGYRPEKRVKPQQKVVLEKYVIDWEHTDKPLKTFWNRWLGKLFGYTEDLKNAVAKEKAQLIAKEEARGVIEYPPAKTLKDRMIKYGEALSKMSVASMLEANKETLERFEKEDLEAKNLAIYEEVKEKLFKTPEVTALSKGDQNTIAAWVRNEVKKAEKEITENDVRGLIKKRSAYFFEKFAARLHAIGAELTIEVLDEIERGISKYRLTTIDAYISINNLMRNHLLPQFLKENKAARDFILEGIGNGPTREEFKDFLKQQLQTTIEEYKGMPPTDSQHKLGEALDRFFNPDNYGLRH